MVETEQRRRVIAPYAERCGSVFEFGGGTDAVVRAQDERQIGVNVIGPPYGAPVIGFGGNPSSRQGPRPNERTLYEIGVRLFTFDRPGYGLSDREAGRSIAGTAAVVEAIADHFDLERFGVHARSGGVPHALGCAALLPERVSAGVFMAGLAPREADIAWTADMSPDNNKKHNLAQNDPEALTTNLLQQAEALKRDTFSLMVDQLFPVIHSSDFLAFIACPADLIAYGHAHGLIEGSGYGWVDDVLALAQPWGFELDSIVCPSVIWHGQDDPFGPVEHSRWLAGRIPTATYIEAPRASHFSLMSLTVNGLTFIRDHHIGKRRAQEFRLAEDSLRRRLLDARVPDVRTTSLKELAQLASKNTLTPTRVLESEQRIRIARRILLAA